jgi:hypothetical protein
VPHLELTEFVRCKGCRHQVEPDPADRPQLGAHTSPPRAKGVKIGRKPILTPHQRNEAHKT